MFYPLLTGGLIKIMSEETLKRDTKTFYTQIAFALVRKIIFSVGVWLAGKGWISESEQTALNSQFVIEQVVGLLLIAFPLVWDWFKVKFNVLFARAALQADGSEKTLRDVKEEVMKENTVVTL